MILMSRAVYASTSLTYEYDANGNLIQGDGKYYEYNDANKLVKVRHGDQTGPVIAQYFYDYTGQRIKKIENGVTTYYIGKHYKEVRDGTDIKKTEYYFANGDRVAKKDSSGNVYYYHSDHLGGTNVLTDSGGNLAERIRYYPFGEIREGGNEKYQFTGKEKDKLTEFYYFEARYYDSDFEHFTQADTVAPNLYDPQDLNRYAYVRNNPLSNIDPSGHSFIDKWYQFKTGLSKAWNETKPKLKDVWNVAKAGGNTFWNNAKTGVYNAAEPNSGYRQALGMVDIVPSPGPLTGTGIAIAPTIGQAAHVGLLKVGVTVSASTVTAGIVVFATASNATFKLNDIHKAQNSVVPGLTILGTDNKSGVDKYFEEVTNNTFNTGYGSGFSVQRYPSLIYDRQKF